MTIPSSRDTFKEFCLRALGKPTIKINVSEDQVDDRVDTSLKYYYDYHFDGSEKVFYKHQITQTDFSNKYITLPDNIIGAVNIFDIGVNSVTGAGDMFNINYQIALNDLYSLTTISMIPYYMTMTNLSLIKELLSGKQPIRYNRMTNKLYVDMDWNRIPIGYYLLVEAYQVVDPDVYIKVWGDRWLAEYCIAQIKRQWGNNTSKYDQITMLGGAKFNGQTFKEEAQKDIFRLEHEMINSYSLPVSDMFG